MSPTYDLASSTAIVTGGAQGIGFAIAERLAESGARVAMIDTDSNALGRSSKKIDALPLTCDVSDASDVASAFETTREQLGAVDIVVNSAGILRDRMLWKLSDNDWHDVINVHLTGTFICTRAAVPDMRVTGRGRIINMTSYTGLHGNIGQANYAAAKAGIVGFTRTAAKELARFNITVNAISPNAETRMVASIPEEKRHKLERMTPLGRFGAPEEIAGAVAFLASSDASYITGVVLPVDGGLSI